MSENITKTEAFKLKGRLYTFTVLQIFNTDRDIFSQQLDETILKAPKLFERTPIVFDLALVNQQDLDLPGLCQIVRQHGMIPVAIQGGNALQETVAQVEGLAILHASSSHDKPVIESTSTENNVLKLASSKLVTTPVRSGRQIVAKGADLIVTSTVSHGAELLSDGSIHVYGALRGRALAGISGNKEARIFCQSLEAELVSIAGYYRLSDAIGLMDVPCQIYLLDGHIHIEPL